MHEFACRSNGRQPHRLLLRRKRIDHALGLDTICLANPSVYPADLSSGSDQTCNGGANQRHPNASYGQLLHLLWSPNQIASSAYSSECKIVLTALSIYGAYLYDTGSNGLNLLAEAANSYTSIGRPDAWAPIRADLQRAGDGDGTNWSSCLNRLSASDFELLAIKPGSY